MPAILPALLLTTLSIAAPNFPDRYWPPFPLPHRVLVSESHNQLSFPEGLLLQTLAGLVASHTRLQGSGEMIWIGTTANPSYDEWLRRWQEYHQRSVTGPAWGVWELVDRYRKLGIIKGYLLCQRDPAQRPLYEGQPIDTSVNVATGLCALTGGVVVEQSLQVEAEQHGLRLLMDVRGRDENWLWRRFGDRLSRQVLALQDPHSFVARDSMVAMGAMVVAGTGALYERTLAALQPGSPILGWGMGAEDALTGPASRQAVFQTATNWCVNLPLLSAGRTGLSYPFEPFRLAPSSNQSGEARGERYVAFVLSDGDNVQWLMLNFCLGQEAQQYWACPDRGAIPFGWTIPAVDLLQLCPYTLDYLRQTATPLDDILLLGGGYYYPDWFGTARPERNLLARQARRTASYLSHTGIRTLLLNLQDWDSPSAMAAYRTYAREMPNLEGILAIQYYPYTAGAGAIRWVRRRNGTLLPVLSARHAIWASRGNHPWEGSPGRVAALLNEWAEQPIHSAQDRFAWVIVHCWSWFRQGAEGQPEEVEQTPPAAPDVARGYRPALWCARRLSPRINIVTPTDLLRRLRMTIAESQEDSLVK